MAIKWNGRMIASLMRKTKDTWNSGNVARGETHCAVGMLARVLGTSHRAVAVVGNQGVPVHLRKVFALNDPEVNVTEAANQIERELGDTDFTDAVKSYEDRLRRAQKEYDGEDLEPMCDILEAVKAEEEARLKALGKSE